MKNEKTNEKAPVGKTAPYWMDEGFIHGIDEAPEGMKWSLNIMSNLWILEEAETPYYCSVSSESYWCS